MQHKSRKQLRLEGQAAQTELDRLKSPEGLAAFLFSRRDDHEFTEAVSLAVHALEVKAQEEAYPEVTDPASTEPPL